ncbi:MAG: TIM barrel protein, partial [Burkholderiales bacterium]|nr:TIM barrel protein [Burkholderiales bacterium]
AGGERGIGCHRDRIAEFEAGVDTAIEYATALGCTHVNCLAGIRPPHHDPIDARETFIKNLQFAAPRLEAAGIKLLIEAINTRDIPGFFLTNTAQAVDIIKAVGSDNLFVQYDIYHMQIMEGDLAPTIEKNLRLIPHMQLADTPGRHEPGTGEINYTFLLDFIDRIGYAGWVGCEYKPAGSTADGLGWAKPYCKRFSPDVLDSRPPVATQSALDTGDPSADPYQPKEDSPCKDSNILSSAQCWRQDSPWQCRPLRNK